MNLSISLIPGKENNSDSLSSGERSGKKHKMEIGAIRIVELWSRTGEGFGCSLKSLGKAHQRG